MNRWMDMHWSIWNKYDSMTSYSLGIMVGQHVYVMVFSKALKNHTFKDIFVIQSLLHCIGTCFEYNLKIR